MQNDTSIPALKRKRVDSGNILEPDGFAISKPPQKPGKAAPPTFHSAFDTSKKHRAAENHDPRRAELSANSKSTATRPLVSVPDFTLDIALIQVADGSRRIASTPKKPTSKVIASSGTKLSTKLNNPSLRFAPASKEVQPVFHENQPIPSASSSTRPISFSKPKIPILPPRQDLTSTKIPAKPMLKSLAPPRLQTPKPAPGQKILPPPPPPPIPVSTPSKPLRTIATTRMARAIDLSTENGAAELASIVLQTSSDSEIVDTTDFKSGLELSPQKSHSFGRGPKFARNGLAAHAASLLSHANTSLVLWAKECSTVSTFPKADLRIRVVRVIHPPVHKTNAPSKIGLALCRLHDKRALIDARPGATSEFPVPNMERDDAQTSIALVLFSFASQPSSSSPIRNAADFRENVEFWVWKPWRTLLLSPSQISASGAVEDTALFCDRFGRYGARGAAD
ncbi:hypothetical protein F5876DRAFT_76809 [Lentinula aff. lateritia]|uniref:Uncharacterized protein n=1 Tax=Lentinula aff. lateritia TaxID=2804960 RepID=A0ACC1U0W8_9AGAR|nr:hypothetical protein F5876DRAFT_76809 [Lentinula aff. lateritia]